MISDAAIARLRETAEGVLVPEAPITISARTLLPILDRLRSAEEGAARYRWLIEQTGHWQDGSNTSVALFQDEATHECIVKIGEETRWSRAQYHSSSTFDAAIDAARAKPAGQ